MNLIVGAPWWLVVFLMLALVAAALEDALRFRISNITCVAVFAAALVAMAVHGLSWDLWQNALLCVAILAVGTMAFAAEWLGGGDVKLLAAIALWFDLSAAAGLIAAVFVAGGFVALLYITVRRLVNATRLSAARKGRVPYGLAIVAGAAFIFTSQISHRHSDPFLDRMRAIQEARHG
jgi:prepilin peptidase CpaA